MKSRNTCTARFSTLICIGASLMTLALASPQTSLSSINPKADSSKALLAAKQQELALEKLKEEISKLREETSSLKITNDAIGNRTKLFTTWLSAAGGAAATLLIGVITFLLNRSFNRTQNAKLQQDLKLSKDKHDLETRKLAQDKQLAREKHLLDLFRELNSDKPRVRIGVIAVLMQRLKTIRGDGNTSEAESVQEFDTIARVLISVTKHEEEPEIQKYIADGLAEALGAIVPEGHLPGKESPLKKYDLQGAKLDNAWWRRVDARGVDFNKASFSGAGLREAFFNEAVLRKANLSRAKLVRADLSNTNLSEADLTNADLSEANLEGADLRGAILKGTIMKRAKYAAAKIDAAALENAVLE